MLDSDKIQLYNQSYFARIYVPSAIQEQITLNDNLIGRMEWNYSMEVCFMSSQSKIGREETQS